MNISMNPNGELYQSAVNAPGTIEIPESFLNEARQFRELNMRYTCAIREVKTKLEVLNDDLAIRNQPAFGTVFQDIIEFEFLGNANGGGHIMASLCGDLDRHPIKHAHEGMKLHVEFRRFPGWIRFGQFPERVVIFCFHQCFTDQSGTGKPCFWGTFAGIGRSDIIR